MMDGYCDCESTLKFVAFCSSVNLRMSGAQDQVEIKFRLSDGSDIGPKNFPVATTVATLKENIIAQWPKGE
ncbi:hypothetical protein BUALT_Bualt16G0020500 [Buddleja alternifolia]|uniref:UBL3-like ubiquitin domain-containing protein n=1 Tax=Buddleja alternifolia TaxID=168488 RepID=A0AAV6W619_9LAMI|nr:hypothetical protein BUALT_Bualt16G0020500 [Buddleja alternifolia]